MQNKLLKKYLLPGYVSSAVCFLLAVGCLDLTRENSLIAKVLFQEDYRFAKSETNYFVIIMLILVLCSFGAYGISSLPEESRKQVEAITRKYVDELLQQNPELQKYSGVLKNPKSLQYVAAIACNGMTKAEQKQILDLVYKTFNGSEKSDFETKQNIEKLHNTILNIVKEHSKKDPEYAKNIIQALETAHNTYIMVPTNQQSR